MTNLIIPTNRQLRFFNRAKLISFQSEHEKPMGCVIVSGNYVVSEGINRLKSHPIQFKNDRKVNYYSPFAKIHAEMDALIRSKDFDLGGCEIYLYRQDKHGNIANSRPCISCMPALAIAGAKHIFYTSTEGYCYHG